MNAAHLAYLLLVPTNEATVSEAVPGQRYYRGLSKARFLDDVSVSPSAAANVSRSSDSDKATVSVYVSVAGARGSASIDLAAAQLRDLAQRCLDAAMDIDMNPAEKLLAAREVTS